MNPNALDWEQNDNKQVAEQLYTGGGFINKDILLYQTPPTAPEDISDRLAGFLATNQNAQILNTLVFQHNNTSVILLVIYKI